MNHAYTSLERTFNHLIKELGLEDFKINVYENPGGGLTVNLSSQIDFDRGELVSGKGVVDALEPILTNILESPKVNEIARLSYVKGHNEGLKTAIRVLEEKVVPDDEIKNPES